MTDAARNTARRLRAWLDEPGVRERWEAVLTAEASVTDTECEEPDDEFLEAVRAGVYAEESFRALYGEAFAERLKALEETR